jgi:hypothetical protein
MFEQGHQDRTAWEQWFNGLQGDYKTGAFYWASQRSLPNPGSCKQMNDQFYIGCTDAKVKLAPSDVLRKSEPDYKTGWNTWTPDEPSAILPTVSVTLPPAAAPAPVAVPAPAVLACVGTSVQRTTPSSPPSCGTVPPGSPCVEAPLPLKVVVATSAPRAVTAEDNPPMAQPVASAASAKANDFTKMLSDTGCNSPYSDERKADIFAQNYKNHTMTVTGEISVLENGRVALKVLPSTLTLDVSAAFADDHAGYNLTKNSRITIRFRVTDQGGCILPYYGDMAEVIQH